jgi:hypothetical protein
MYAPILRWGASAARPGGHRPVRSCRAAAERQSPEAGRHGAAWANAAGLTGERRVLPLHAGQWLCYIRPSRQFVRQLCLSEPPGAGVRWVPVAGQLLSLTNGSFAAY